MAWLLLALSLSWLMLATFTLWPVRRNMVLAALNMAVGMLGGELAPHVVVTELALTILLAWAGALAAWPGVLGLAITALSWTLLLVSYVRGGHQARRAMAHIAPEIQLGDDSAHPWLAGLFGIPPLPVKLERISGIIYRQEGRRGLRLDVVRRPTTDPQPQGRPVIVFVHGGGFVVGSRSEQGRPLLHAMAQRGWVGVSVGYRLGPWATWPGQVVDVKAALAWVKEHIVEYGGDPTFVALSGGSAGGLLAALAALTPNDPEFQPGFEAQDTSVQACVPCYPVLDLLDRHQLVFHQGVRLLMERAVARIPLHDDPGLFERSSPMGRIHADAPPFLLVVGSRDSLVSAPEIKRFGQDLASVSRNPVAVVEIPGGHHAFDVFASPRTAATVQGISRFLESVHREARRT